MQSAVCTQTQYIDVLFKAGLLVLGVYRGKHSTLLNSANNNIIMKN